MSSLFSAVTLAPSDPILGLNEKFNADTNPKKVNLGVGVYCDDTGKLPLLSCVKSAEQIILANPTAHNYLPIDGLPAYTSACKNLIFGQDSEAVQSSRIVSVQALGGTGALRLGADFINQLNPGSTVLISSPSWANHQAIFQKAGFTVAAYPYYDAANKAVDLAGMLAALQQAEANTVVVLHACCHNPTGYDLSSQEWQQVIDICRSNQLIPFLDMAYQGFGFGIGEDGAVVQQFVDSGLNFFIASSFSKSLGLYGERVGALSVVCDNKDDAKRVLSQLKVVIRTNYSNPSTFGVKIAATVLQDAALYQLWEQELTAMRERIKNMRQQLVAGLVAAGVEQNMDFITKQLGMFSFSGLSKEQMHRLRNEFGIYGTDNGRICIAALNSGNIAYVSQAIAQVLK